MVTRSTTQQPTEPPAPTAAQFRQCNPVTSNSTLPGVLSSMSQSQPSASSPIQQDDLIPLDLSSATTAAVSMQDQDDEPFQCNYYYSDNLCFDVSLQI